MLGMDKNRYETEILDENDDDGTMPKNVGDLAKQVVGHKIVSVRKDVELPHKMDSWRNPRGTEITLDTGKRVFLVDSGDCCAATDLEAFLLHPEMVDHIITGIGTTGAFTTWHIYADMGNVLELTVGWSCGEPFYYGYGFEILVYEPGATTPE